MSGDPKFCTAIYGNARCYKTAGHEGQHSGIAYTARDVCGRPVNTRDVTWPSPLPECGNQ